MLLLGKVSFASINFSSILSQDLELILLFNFPFNPWLFLKLSLLCLWNCFFQFPLDWKYSYILDFFGYNVYLLFNNIFILPSKAHHSFYTAISSFLSKNMLWSSAVLVHFDKWHQSSQERWRSILESIGHREKWDSLNVSPWATRIKIEPWLRSNAFNAFSSLFVFFNFVLFASNRAESKSE